MAAWTRSGKAARWTPGLFIHRLPDGEGMTTVAELAEEWNVANPNIQVKTTKFDGKAADLVTKIEADVQAGTSTG